MNLASKPDSGLLNKIPVKIALQWKIIPLRTLPNGFIQVAVADDENLERLENIAVFLGSPIEPVRFRREEIEETLQQFFGVGADAIDDLPINKEAQIRESVDSSDAAIARFVNDLIGRAFRDRATDIHIEPREDFLSVRFRIDGLLQIISVPPTLIQHHARLVSRIKIMAQLNIAEKRIPQDGRVKFQPNNKEEIDLRVSILPTIHGESIDLRLLPRTRLVLGLQELVQRWLYGQKILIPSRSSNAEVFYLDKVNKTCE